MATNVQIRLERVSKSYAVGGKGPMVLKNVSASIAAGDFTVIVGRSGSGKSTLLNLIGGLDAPTLGEICIDGQLLTELDETGLALLRRHRIGFIFQFFNLIPTLTVSENIQLPLELIHIKGKEAAERCLWWLERVGLGDCVDRFPDELSGGEQQRVAIARALVHEPQIILADEPTGNLDLDTAQQIVELLDRLCRDGGKTLVMVTHSRDVVGLADRVLTIRDSHLEEFRS